MYFLYVAIISPCKKCMAQLEKIFKSCHLFLSFCFYLHLTKGQGPSFERNWIPLTQGCSVPSLVEIGPVVLENKSSMYFHYVAFISR